MKTQIREVTPEIALDLLKCNTRNRPLKQKVVIDYAIQMKKGLWKENGESIIMSDGNMLLDGQHRLAAIVKSGTTQKILVVTGVKSDSFDTIDTGLVRSAGDILAIDGVRSYYQKAAGIAKYFSMKNGFVSTTGLKSLKCSKQEILIECKLHSELYNEIDVICARCIGKLKLMPRSIMFGIMAYLIIEKKHSKEKVFSFFKQLFFNEEVENSTISALREKLTKDAIGQYKLTPAAFNAIFAKTWNAYVINRQYKNLSFNPEKETIPTLL